MGSWAGTAAPADADRDVPDADAVPDGLVCVARVDDDAPEDGAAVAAAGEAPTAVGPPEQAARVTAHSGSASAAAVARRVST
ncbi:MAG: hypothetical protein ACKVZ6_17075 [Kineosporiaceae bacterium]